MTNDVLCTLYVVNQTNLLHIAPT